MRQKYFPVILAAGIGLMGLLVGCQSGEQEYNPRTMRFERVGPRERSTPRTSNVLTETGELKQAPQYGGPPPRHRLSARQQTAAGRVDVHRLYIGDLTALDSMEPELLYVARHTRPDRLSELLALLYPGKGPGGSDRIRYLLYSDEETWEQAMAMAERLDVTAQDMRPETMMFNSENISEWNMAIGLIYGCNYPRRMDPETRTRVLSQLKHLIADPSTETEIRWASTIIAANLNSRFDPKQYAEADALLRTGMQIVPSESYFSMVLRYHQIRLLSLRGQNLTAKQQAQETLNRYQNWSHTDGYQMIIDIMNQN